MEVVSRTGSITFSYIRHLELPQAVSHFTLNSPGVASSLHFEIRDFLHWNRMKLANVLVLPT